MSYVTENEIEFVGKYLAAQGFSAKMLPGALPGESPAVIRIEDGALFEIDEVAEEVAAGAQLWSLLHELNDRQLNADSFDYFGGTRCRDLVRQHSTCLGLVH
ncbi:hypothetical protein A9R05_44770 (plasmid) [Burkholderia sp. KK1]|uniref:Uncharacterized protein n=1 Tax=Burkholderia sp. M701 TaxID=326454 RepID=V5YPU3_9BURK|nr:MULTISPECIES: hypothetical protein [Burkholderia]AQH06054.1 hypothetical protein A9R05_44770 [Burkholderia sp. KK1]BAO19299.1 hypothetical protein [Burkholderia sp. M701]